MRMKKTPPNWIKMGPHVSRVAAASYIMRLNRQDRISRTSNQQRPRPNPSREAPPRGVTLKLWNRFRSVDKDHSGKISVQELQKALEGNRSPFNEATCRLMVGMFDQDGSGTIDVHEFCALWKYVKAWNKIFDSYNKGQSSCIDATALHQAFTSFGYNLSIEFAQVVIQKFDRFGRGSIDYDEFIQSCVMLQCLTKSFRAKDKQQEGIITLSYEEFLEMTIDTTIRK